MFTHSKKWKSPAIKEKEQWHQLNKARHSSCPESFAWTKDFPIMKHRQDMKIMRDLYDERNADIKLKEEEDRIKYNLSKPQPVKACRSTVGHLNGKEFDTNHSAVLAEPTIWVPSYEKRPADAPPLALWPCKEEQLFEGDRRIENEKLNGRVGRMLPAPRVTTNATVTWAYRPLAMAYEFDCLFREIDLDPVEIFIRHYWIPELEMTEDDGNEKLGKDLMEMLNCGDRLWA